MSFLSPVCPHCSQPAALVTGRVLYPHRPDLARLNFWRCDPCDAHVGCHKAGARYERSDGALAISNGTNPLGMLANASLRIARHRAHGRFDRLWQSGWMSRHEAYDWLATTMNVDRMDAHIGGFDAGQCWAVADAASAKAREFRSQWSSETELAEAGPAEPSNDRKRRLANAPTRLAKAHIAFETFNRGEHLVVRADDVVVDFWPSTQLWMVRGDASRHQGIRPLVRFCTRA